MDVPHYFTADQVQRLLDALASHNRHQARTAALIIWRTGLRISEALDLEWRDLDYRGDPPTLIVRQSKSGKARTVPLHGELVALFTNWPTSYGSRDRVVPLTMRTALRHIGDGIRWVNLDEESPGTGKRLAGAHSLRHSAARHWLMVGRVPLNIVSQWLGHSTVQVTLRIYLPIVGSTYSMADRVHYLQEMVALVARLVEDGFSEDKSREMMSAALTNVDGPGEVPYARGTCIACGAVHVAWSEYQWRCWCGHRVGAAASPGDGGHGKGCAVGLLSTEPNAHVHKHAKHCCARIRVARRFRVVIGE